VVIKALRKIKQGRGAGRLCVVCVHTMLNSEGLAHSCNPSYVGGKNRRTVV
jgi:hypothetical protein